MVMGGMSAYRVSCTKCNWSDNIVVRKEQSILPDFLNPSIPNKCPKCKSKITKFKMPVKF